MMEKDNPSYAFKILLIGNSGVGKTSLVRRFCMNEFTDNTTSTIGVDFLPYLMNIDKTLVRLQIWDTSGQEQFRSLGKAYYRNAIGAIIVFSFTSHQSFEDLSEWIDSVQHLCAPQAQILLVANKHDLIENKEVTIQEAETFARSQNLELIITSAKTDYNVKESFFTLIRGIIQKIQTNAITPPDQGEPVRFEQQNQKSGECKC